MIGKQLIENWFVGNAEEKIPPCVLLKYNYLKYIKGACNNLRIMKSFMLLVEKYTVIEGIWEANTSRWSISYANLLLKRAGMPHLNAKYSSKNRSIDVD